MPIYEYLCDQGHLFEVLQKISAEPLTECRVCGAPAHRKISLANLPRQAGVYVFDKRTGRDILHDSTLSDRERSAELGPLISQMQEAQQGGGEGY